MTLPSRFSGIALALALAGCASTPPGLPMKVTNPAAPPSAEERDRGVAELSIHVAGMAGQAVYGPWRVASRGVDLNYAGDGKWSGTLGAKPVNLSVTEGRIEGSGVNLYLFEDAATRTVTVRGLASAREIWITMTPDTLRGRVAANAPGFELKREGPGKWTGSWGPGRTMYLEMRGEAAQYPAVLSPQFYLALIGGLL
jgi:hypothetical protein